MSYVIYAAFLQQPICERYSDIFLSWHFIMKKKKILEVVATKLQLCLLA